jgi:molybdopterin adenylyltransferase
MCAQQNETCERSVAVLTISDKASRGERTDRSGPALATRLTEAGFVVVHEAVVADEQDQIASLLCHYSDANPVALIFTSGGTGVAPRDVTPEATLSVIHRPVPGMAEAMRAASMLKTPHAMISRGVVGIRGKTLIVNLPGSPRGALENLEVILPALPHALSKIQGDATDCASSEQ